MYVATRDAMLGHTGEADPWKALKALDVAAVEVWIDADMKTTSFHGAKGGKPFDLGSDAGVQALDERADEHGIAICALCMANDFSADDLDAQVAWGVAAVSAARALGAPAVRVDMVPHKKDVELDWFLERCVEAAKKVLDQTSDSGVALAVENHGKITNRPDVLKRIFDGVGSDRMGITLDSGNFYWYGHPIESVYETFAEFAPRARHTHVKNIKYPEDQRAVQREIGWEYGKYVSPLDEGDIDHQRFCQILKDAGYDGSIVLEDESLGKADEADRLAILQRDVAHLKTCVG